MSTQAKRRSLFDPQIMRRASVDALRKLNPRAMMRNPVMFVVELGSVLTTGENEIILVNILFTT